MCPCRFPRIVPRIVATAIVLALLAGCATNPITGRSQFLLVSEEQAIGSSTSAYTSMIGQLSKKDKVERGTARAQRVREITDRLIAQAVRFRPGSAKWDWEIQVIDEPKTVNAFCMAGGKMGIYTGMWEKLQANDDEIAAVMGHEIGHALASHTREKMSMSIAVGLGTAVVAAAASRRDDSNSFERNLFGLELAAALAISLPNSRNAETEADRIGIELAARAGYDPRAAVTLWKKMAKEGGGAPEFLSTHPAPQTRIATLNALVPKVEHLYQLARSGKPVGDVPTFLSEPNASNERRVGPVSREDYAKRAASRPETMTFLAEPFERFKRGETMFGCRFACYVSYTTTRDDWRMLHDRKAWRDLAVSVIQVGYLSDLSYFLLGEAARGLGLRDTAHVYYRHALVTGAEYSCGDDAADCAGFDVKRQSASALR